MGTVKLVTPGLEPQFFDADGVMADDVRTSLLAMADDVLADLIEQGYALMPELIVLTGSLAGHNWDSASDLDLHIVYDPARFGDPATLRHYLDLYAKRWGENEYLLDAHPVELYFQDVREPHTSPGVYDLVGNHWTKVPHDIHIDIPPQVAQAAAHELTRVRDYAAELPLITDGGLSYLEKLKALWQAWRAVRKEGLTGLDGDLSFGNLLFKALRRNRAIELLVELMRRAKAIRYAPATIGKGE